MGDYTDAEITAAFYADEIARYNLLLGKPQRPEFAGLALARGEVADPVTEADITLSDIDLAVAELAAQRGADYADMWDQVRLAADGERDAVSLASALVGLATGQPVKEKPGDVEDEAGEEDEDEEDLDDQERARRARRAKARRRKTASQGSSTEAPGPSGGMESGSVAAAQRQRWARAGVVGLSAGDYGEEAGEEDRIARDHPEYFGGKRPRVKGMRAETRVEDEEHSDRRQPHRGGDVHPEVARYLRELNRASGAEKPHGSVQVHPPQAGRRAG
jgi:hypothetical protein